MSDRIIIGECAQAGLPISAPVKRPEQDGEIPETSLRWHKHGESFSLEQWRILKLHGPTRGVWVEVPCVVDDTYDKS